MRSRSGWLFYLFVLTKFVIRLTKCSSACKLRKLKCDEAKPSCGPCRRGSRTCEFLQSSIFRCLNGSFTFTRGDERSEPNSELFDESNVWLQVPAKLTFVHIENPYDLDVPETLTQNHITNIAKTPDILAGDHDAPRDNTPPLSTTAYEDEIHTTETPLTPFETLEDVRVFEIQLMRYFSQVPSQWMDVFDTTAFFSTAVPLMAASDPLLKCAACALAAKHLGRVESAEPATATLRSLAESLSQLSQPSTQRTWVYQAAQYYGRALGLLKQAIHLLGPVEGFADSAGTGNVFAAVAMLGTFEMMDAPADGWRAHLDALPMFVATSTATAFSPMTLPRITVKGSAFWNLVRLDLICAFVSERQTRLNLESIPSWQNAGLAVDNTGEVLPFSPFTSTRCDVSSDIIEDAKSNELLWLLGKVINFLTAGDAMNPDDFALPLDQRLPLGVTQEQLLERWESLDNEFRKWQSSLPLTFEVIARTNTGCVSPGLEQIWYELPICAAAMQTYHMASILLLVNKPQESTAIRSTLASRLRHYRTVPQKVLWHAREICGISLADPVDSVRIHSILPLFTAGQVVYEPKEQSLIQDLLSSIETELGWTTTYHRDKLYQGWIEMAQPV